MKKEFFNPIYNETAQVKRCVESMLREPVASVELGIVIGFNGQEFVTSTDWRVTTESGLKQILPFTIQTQYPSFLECKAGTLYTLFEGNILVLPDGKDVKEAQVVETAKPRKSAVVIIDDESYRFEPGEDILIKVNPEKQFLATDCFVECEEQPDCRIYKVKTDDATYGIVENEKISIAR